MSESGKYSHYIAETAEAGNHFSQLLAEQIEAHFLCGEKLSAPPWSPLSSTNFSFAAVAGGLVAGAVVIGAGSSGSSGDVQDAADTTAPEATTAEVANNGVSVTGKAEPGSTVNIKDADANEIGKAVADKNGDYTAQLDTALTNGEHITVDATDKDGNISDKTEATAPDLNSLGAPFVEASDIDGGVTVKTSYNSKSEKLI